MCLRSNFEFLEIFLVCMSLMFNGSGTLRGVYYDLGMQTNVSFKNLSTFDVIFFLNVF